MVHVGTSAPKKSPNYPIVLVTWADAHMSDGGWLDLDDYEDNGECLVQTTGFLVPVGDPGSKEGHVTVWQSLCENEGIHGTHIPVGMVRDIKVTHQNNP